MTVLACPRIPSQSLSFQPTCESHSIAKYETAPNFVLVKRKEKVRESGDDILALFLDWKRVLESIDRNRLLTKLRAFGFSPRVIECFEGYLKERNQLTKVNGYSSRKLHYDLGVPQGSVLGAISFILYISEIYIVPSQQQNAFINLFADGTLIHLHGKNLDTMR